MGKQDQPSVKRDEGLKQLQVSFVFLSFSSARVGVPLLLPEKARRSKPHSSKTIARDPDLCLVLAAAAAAERSSAASFEASAFKCCSSLQTSSALQGSVTIADQSAEEAMVSIISHHFPQQREMVMASKRIKKKAEKKGSKMLLKVKKSLLAGPFAIDQKITILVHTGL
ncbi:hypothetical protein RIF29_32901 [Crotalaria pallida]|uniref:Uncharacterized protein n=1 Tax=Crotalaria pallida TaxID=3830 RepID=A0AAN9E7S2_CROPI